MWTNGTREYGMKEIYYFNPAFYYLYTCIIHETHTHISRYINYYILNIKITGFILFIQM